MAFAVRRKIESSENWRSLFYDFLDTRLDKIGNVKSYMKNRKIYDRDIKGKSGINGSTSMKCSIKRNYKFQQMSNEI